MTYGWEAMPRWVGAYAERAIAARDDPERVAELMQSSTIPIVIYDDDRYCVDANGPAEAALGTSRASLLGSRLDDLTPGHLHESMLAGWASLMETGVWAGPLNTERPENGTWLGIVYFWLANLLPSRHFNAFAPMGWPGAHTSTELLGPLDGVEITPRELEILELAAGGFNVPAIAESLVISPETVRTHFKHVYEKLDVGDRAAAVAKAMRYGLIV